MKERMGKLSVEHIFLNIADLFRIGTGQVNIGFFVNVLCDEIKCKRSKDRLRKHLNTLKKPGLLCLLCGKKTKGTITCPICEQKLKGKKVFPFFSSNNTCAGVCLKARQVISKNEIITDYNLVPPAQSPILHEYYDVNKLRPDFWSLGRFANSSCRNRKPNASFEKGPNGQYLKATKKININDEITWDYRGIVDFPSETMKCFCCDEFIYKLKKN